MATKSKTGTRRTFRINNMTGLLNTIAEANSYFNIDPNASLGPAGLQIRFEFQDLNNWVPIYRGGLSKTFGHSDFFDTGSATKLTGISRFSKADGTSFFVYSQGTKVYKLVSGVATDLGFTLANGNYTDFTVAYDRLIVVDGSSNPQVWDGSTVTDLATGGDGAAIASAKSTTFYKSRLWAITAGHDRSLVYYSDAEDITAGYASNFVPCAVDDGQNITALLEFFIPGELEPVLLVGKERSVGIIRGDGTLGNPFTFVKVSNDLGIPGFRQLIQAEQDAYFLTNRGITSYQTAISQNANIAQRILSRNITPDFIALQGTFLGDALGWYDSKHRRVSFAVPTQNNQFPDRIYHYDIELGGFYKQDGFNITAAFVDTDGVLYFGNDTGHIYKQDPTVFNYAGGPISATLKTPAIDFFEPDYYKRINHARITVRGNGTYNLAVTTSFNYGLQMGNTYNIPLTAGVYTWGGGVWTDDPGVYQWGGAPLKPKKFFPGGIFQNITFELNQSGADEPIDLLEMVFEVEYLNLI